MQTRSWFVVIVFVVVGACSANATPTTSPGSTRVGVDTSLPPANEAVALPRHDGGNDLRLEVIVRADPANRCVSLERRGERHAALWGRGTSATFDPFLLYDELGAPVAENGDRIVIAGGVIESSPSGPCGGYKTILAGPLSEAINLTNPNLN